MIRKKICENTILEIEGNQEKNNILNEALAIATAQVLEEIKQYQQVPSFGRVEVETNENRT